jgi:hypothetical protein
VVSSSKIERLVNYMGVKYNNVKDLLGIDEELAQSSESEPDNYIVRKKKFAGKRCQTADI